MQKTWLWLLSEENDGLGQYIELYCNYNTSYKIAYFQFKTGKMNDLWFLSLFEAMIYRGPGFLDVV